MVDLLSLRVILLILVASGGIAYVADGLGKKIGKKRISVRVRGWSMRPKHVASLGTVAMGVFVSMLTIGFIAAVSKDAREWLKQGGQLLVQREELRRSNEKLRLDVQAEKNRLTDLNGQIVKDKAQIAKEQANVQGKLAEVRRLDASLESKSEALRVANLELDKRQRAIDGLQAQLPRLREQVTLAQGQVRTANALLTTVRGSLVSVKRSLLVAQKDLDTARHDAQAAHLRSQEAYKESLNTFKELTDEVNNRKELVAHLKEEATGLVAQRDDAQAQADAAQARYTEVRGQLEGADKELVQMQEALRSQATFLNGGFKTSRTEAMTFRRGEEVARIVVPADSDVETARAKLDALLRVARIDATERGAKSHRAGGQTFEAADVVERKDPKTGAIADADTLKRALIANLAGKPEDQVLVATSSLNAFVGEPVSLDLMPMPNPVVYRRNDTVAETRIDGSLTEDRILAQLSEFMNGPLRQKATRDRMIPRVGTAAPFGEPSVADVWVVLQNVRKAGRSVRVQAIAGDDIRAADPLRVEFKVH